MTLLALALVLTAALLHATWNYWAKRAGGGLPFVYLLGTIICLGYVPVVTLYLSWHPVKFSGPICIAIAVSGLLKTAYSLLLQRAYRTGDFSLIYPLARGTGPLLATLGAILFLGEKPSIVALSGAFAIVCAIFWVAGGHRWFSRDVNNVSVNSLHRSKMLAVFYGMAAGVFIAAYTLWDKHGVASLAIAPIVYDAGTSLVQVVLLTPFAWKRRSEVVFEWRQHRRNAFIIAATAPLGYVLILTAMRFTPVSYVAPAREVSILIGLFFGARWLNEKEAHRRVWAAVVMLMGLAALAHG